MNGDRHDQVELISNFKTNPAFALDWHRARPKGTERERESDAESWKNSSFIIKFHTRAQRHTHLLLLRMHVSKSFAARDNNLSRKLKIVEASL